MRDLLPALRRWYDAGSPFGLATVVAVSRSAPRSPGAAMAVGPGAEVVGSVSGGCVEGAVFDLVEQVVATGEPQLATYGYRDDDAYAVGLTCGGAITVLARPVSAQREPHFGAVATSVQTGEPVALATIVSGLGQIGATIAIWDDRVLGSLGGEGLDVAATSDARGLLRTGETQQRHYGANGEPEYDDVAVFVQAFAPPARMLVFGATDFAAALTRIGAFLGYRVTVCDARPIFATPQRFPHADDVVLAWPHRYLAETAVDPRTVICVLTHDMKFDVPLLKVALRANAGYVGAMGSRRTRDQLVAQLRAVGLSEAELARLHAPIGLDVGARTPQETAVSIAAEIIAARGGSSGLALSTASGNIHAERLRE